jgi:hypothetical protein
MAHDHHDHSQHSHGSDAKAAFTGLIVGAIILFGIIRTIVYLTNAHYTGERPAAEATK